MHLKAHNFCVNSSNKERGNAAAGISDKSQKQRHGIEPEGKLDDYNSNLLNTASSTPVTDNKFLNTASSTPLNDNNLETGNNEGELVSSLIEPTLINHVAVENPEDIGKDIVVFIHFVSKKIFVN